MLRTTVLLAVFLTHLASVTILHRAAATVIGEAGRAAAVRSPSALATPDAWLSASSPLVARTRHTATLLPTGKLLIAGGTTIGGGYALLASAELYDPAADLWRSTAPMATPRDLFTATLLANGKVLVVGGQGALATAELYDPATGAWTPTGSLATGRSLHTATLLPTGRVLVAGGRDNFGLAVAGAELYDPATGTWTPAGALTPARYGHTATLLHSGKVLLAGGAIANTAITAAEVYDPGAGTWTIVASLAVARINHTATVLPSGRVLVAGGFNAGMDYYFPGVLASAELYDPISDRWSVAGSLNGSRGLHTAVLLTSGKVLVAGGLPDPRFTLAPNCELYDPVSGAWAGAADLFLFPDGIRDHTVTLLPSGNPLLIGGSTATLYRPAYLVTTQLAGPLATARHGHTATLLPNGQVLAAGGQSAAGPLDSCELFDTATGTWQPTTAMSRARSNHTATLLPASPVLPHGGVLVVGGQASGSETLDSAEIYDPTTGRWTSTKPLSVTRTGHTATLLISGKVLVVGGDPLGPDWTPRRMLASAEIYDPATATWSATASMQSARASHTATLLLSGKVLVAGGVADDSFLGGAEIFDPALGTWQVTGSLRINRELATATLLPSGQVLMVGGFGGPFRGAHVNVCELYDPLSESWIFAGSLPDPGRSEHTAVLLPSGKVLIAGGSGGTSAGYSNFDLSEGQGDWLSVGVTTDPRKWPTATLLPSGQVLLAGGVDASGDSAVTELIATDSDAVTRRPVIISAPSYARFGEPITLAGHFAGDSQATSGTTSESAVNAPLVQVTALATGQRFWVPPDPRANFSDDPMDLNLSDLPAQMSTGWHQFSVVTAGRASAARLIHLNCSVAITREPQDQRVPIGFSARFSVVAAGGRAFQWQKDGVDIPGATAATYTTPPASASDAGTVYYVVVSSGCARLQSRSAVLTIEEHDPPTVTVTSPNGGEYWLLSTRNPITWTMADQVRICQVVVSLWYSNDGGSAWVSPQTGGVLASFGGGSDCAAPGQTATSLLYTIPTSPPSGVVGSLYKIQVQVVNQAGLVATAVSANPFFIVQPNPNSVRTLILANLTRMQTRLGLSAGDTANIKQKLKELAGHPRVLGLVVDLDGVTDLAGLYAAWDADPGSTDKANRVLFGCHTPPAGCAGDMKGIHDVLQDLVAIYPNIKYLVLVGDDRIIPLARLADGTAALLPESTYTNEGNLRAAATTVGQALAAGRYLSDDPLASLGPIQAESLGPVLLTDVKVFIPDLAVGRLVENPAEIVTAIAAFISHDGVLDLSALDPARGHKVLVTGYDFLLDSSRVIRKLWKDALQPGLRQDDLSLAPVDGSLLTASWGLATSADRSAALLAHLSGNGGDPYAISVLDSHGAHFEEGVPGVDPFDIEGLLTAAIYGAACGRTPVQPLSPTGRIILAVGCHGGLPVPDDCNADGDHSLDLPQTMLARGALVYVGNSGYGWGLVDGIGYSERLMQIVAEEMTAGGEVVTGDLAAKAKLRYYLEAPRFDPYDAKTLMQWTFYGLPMYAVKTGIKPPSTAARAFNGRPRKPVGGGTVDRLGGVSVRRALSGAAVEEAASGDAAGALTIPPYLTRLDLHFDFSGSNVFTKRDALGNALPPALTGCPPPADPLHPGCYYTLNGLVDRASGESDLPIQPYFIYDSRLAGTSQHGVLWKGGTYLEERGWTPVVAQLASNRRIDSGRGATPERDGGKVRSRRWIGGAGPDACTPSDTESNSIVVPAGEALKLLPSDASLSVERHYLTVDLEAFYFNDIVTPQANCDRGAATFQAGTFDGTQDPLYHKLEGSILTWQVPVTAAAGIWRVVVVYSGGQDAQGRPAWKPLDLQPTTDNPPIWRGQLDLHGLSNVSYVIQAVDNRGNVTWLGYAASPLPASGVPLDLPRTVDVVQALRYFTVAPCRIVDTRDASGPTTGAPLSAGQITLALAGSCGIPATARAVSANVTVTQPTAMGYLAIFPGDQATTNTSTINFSAGQTRANNAILALGARDGAASVQVKASLAGTVHFIVDVTGYFQ